MENTEKTGVDLLREQIGSQEQNEYVLIALGIQYQHSLEPIQRKTEWFDYSWTDREKTAFIIANDIFHLKQAHNEYIEQDYFLKDSGIPTFNTK